MKAKKVLKRMAKIEALISEVTERSSESAPHIRKLLRDAKAAVIRAKEAVSSQASHKAKNPPVGRSKPTSIGKSEAPKPKRELSAAGRAAIAAATKRRWALKRAEAAKSEQAAPKKTATKKAAVNTAPVTTAKKAVKKAATKVAVQKAAPKKPAPAKTKRPVKQAANNSAPVIAQPIVVTESAATSEGVA